jgi:hypothetical protein
MLKLFILINVVGKEVDKFNLGCNVNHNYLLSSFHVAFKKAKCVGLLWIRSVVKVAQMMR